MSLTNAQIWESYSQAMSLIIYFYYTEYFCIYILSSASQTFKYILIAWGSGSIQQVWGEALQFWISKKLPSDANAAGPHS